MSSPAMSAPPVEQPPALRAVLNHLAPSMLMGFVMCLAYLAGFHAPSPHHLPVAVVGEQQQVQPIAAGLRTSLGDKVDVRILPDPETAATQLRETTIQGAYVPEPGSATIMLNPAAGETTANVAQRIMQSVATQQHLPTRVDNVVDLDAQDPTGQGMFFYLVALTVGSYATGIAIAVAGARRRVRSRVGIAVGAGIVVAGVTTLLTHLVFGLLPHSTVEIGAIAALYSVTTMLFAIGLHPLIGRWTTMTMAGLFVALNFPSSGGVFSTMLQNDFFAGLGHFWIGNGLHEIGRNLTYLPHLGIADGMVKILGWTVVGALLVLIAAAREQRNRSVAARPAERSDEDRVTPQEETELEEDVAV